MLPNIIYPTITIIRGIKDNDWVIELGNWKAISGWANKIAQQLLTNHKLPNSPTAKLLGIFSVGQSIIAQLLGKIWLNKVIDQNWKYINCFHGFMA